MTKSSRLHPEVLILSFALFLPAGSSSLAQGPVLYQDDFSDGDRSAWITFESGWSESGGQFHSSNQGASIPVEALYSLGFGWADYRAEVDVRTSSAQPTSALHLFVRDIGIPSTQAGRSFGSCDLFRNNLNQTFLVAGIHGPTGEAEQQVLGFGWNANTTYRLRATVSGQTLTCEVVGAIGASLSVTSSMLSPAGTVGLRATHIPGDFDNLLVVNIGAENEPPVADAGDDQMLAAGTACTAEAVLDGSASFDPDGDLLSFVWESASAMPLTGVSPAVTLPLGSHEFTLTVADGRNGEDSDQVLVTVEDRSPPVISEVVMQPDVLWPPNHKMLAVEIEAVAEDNCMPAPACHILDVTSSEPPDSPGTAGSSPDWRITGDLSLDLRAERSGGRDRSYTVSVLCADASGNETIRTGMVLVPHHR